MHARASTCLCADLLAAHVDATGASPRRRPRTIRDLAPAGLQRRPMCCNAVRLVPTQRIALQRSAACCSTSHCCAGPHESPQLETSTPCNIPHAANFPSNLVRSIESAISHMQHAICEISTCDTLHADGESGTDEARARRSHLAFAQVVLLRHDPFTRSARRQASLRAAGSVQH